VSHGTVDRKNYADRAVTHVVAKYPPALGGMEQVVHHLARNQHELGADVSVLTSNEECPDSFDEEDTFPIVRLRSSNVAHTTIMPGLLARLRRLGPYSVVHLHISCAYIPEMVWLSKKLGGAPYLAHLHLDVLPSGRAGLLLGPYKRIFLRRVLHDAAAVIVPTEDYGEIVRAKYGLPRDRVFVIGNGTDHRIAEGPRSLEPTDARKKILFVGRLSVQKNIPLLLNSLENYVTRYGDNVQLTIVGEGEQRPAIESQIARLGLGGTVELRGRLDGEALESLYEESDLFLLTSTNESFGLVLIEAMTKGLPIVTVNIPAVRNVVLDEVNGLLTDSTPEALADAIHALLSDEILYAAISKNNLAKSLDYGWTAIAGEFLNRYEVA
jgi:glycosyltransferase involved in cell wall biosynthesis